MILWYYQFKKWLNNCHICKFGQLVAIISDWFSSNQKGKKWVIWKVANFDEKYKAIALLFGQKWGISKMANFDEKCKAIALLFGQELSHLKSGQFWWKMQGYSLTFWAKNETFENWPILMKNARL